MTVNGFHVGIPANTNNIDLFFDWMALHNVPFLAKNVDNSAGLIRAQELIQGGHDGVIVYRILRGGDTPPYGSDINSAIEAYMQKVYQYFPPELNKSLVYLELINETNKDSDADVNWTGEFCTALATRLVNEGYKFCGPGWASGTPEPYHWEMPGWVSYLRLCEQYPDKVAVAIHEYSLSNNMTVDGWLIGRFRFIHDACDKNGIAHPQIFITEWGWGHSYIPDNWAEQLSPVAQHYAQYPNIRGAAVWCLDLGSLWDNLGDRVNPAMVWANGTTPLGETVKDIVPEPPPPPPSDENIIINGSFEGGWADVPPAPDRLQQPDGWVLDVKSPGTTLWAINRKTGTYPISQSLPECVHKESWQLPPDEQPGGENALILDGDTTYKFQAPAGVLPGCILRQSVPVISGGRYRIIVNAQVHYHDVLNEPDDVELWVMVEGTVQRALWAKDMPDRTWVQVEFEYVATSADLALELRWQHKWANARDLFIDALKVYATESPTPPSFNEWLEDEAESHRVIDYNSQAALQKAIVADGFAPYSGEFWDTYADGQEYAIQGARDLSGEEKRVYYAVVGDWGNVKYIIQGEEPPSVNIRPLMANQPLDEQSIETRGFGECPECYNDIPSYQPDCGHGGNDRGVPLRTKVYATQRGVVVHASDRKWNSDTPSGYGKHIVIEHNENGQRFHSVYSHCDLLFVSVGQGILAGAYIAKSGNTGNSTGPHLHYGVLIDDDWGGCHGELRFGYFVDPAYVFDLPLAPKHTDPPGTSIDLLPYIKGSGQMYEVQHASGPTETFQSQSSGLMFYQVKNSQYEELYESGDFIWRGLDTSPGGAPNEAERPGEPRYYRQFEEGKQMARWCPRFMKVGQSWIAPSPHTVQFYYKSDCAPSSANSGQATNQITLVAWHETKTWNGITVSDVIELRSPFETYFYAKGWGLVAWGMGTKQSAISEVLSGRPPLVRESGCW